MESDPVFIEITPERLEADWNASGRLKEDAFVGTFLAKWRNLIGDRGSAWAAVDGPGGRILGAIVATHSKRLPRVQNLQLLHTFHEHRGNGVARDLCGFILQLGIDEHGAKYHRVSAEKEAVGFYRRAGYKFWGSQKSGCLMSIFRIGGRRIQDGVYDRDDPVIRAAIGAGSRRKGCVTEMYDEPH